MPAHHADDEPLSVADRVMLKFIAAAEVEPNLKDIATRLRQALLVDHATSEVALRKALFGDDL